MKKVKILTTIVLCGIFAIAIQGCKKNDLGVSESEKKLTAHTWKLSKYLRNGNDETASLYIKNYEETYSGIGGGNYSRSYKDKNGNLESETGTWAFESDQKNLIISGVSSLDINIQSGTVASSYYTIVKLEQDEFWYFFKNGADRHEFRFVTK